MVRQVSTGALCVPSQYIIKVSYSFFFQINLIRESLDFFLDALRIQSESIPLMRAVMMGYTKMVEVYNLDALKSISITRLQGHD